MKSHKHIAHKKQNVETRARFPIIKNAFWFLIGMALGLFLLVSFVFIGFKNTYAQRTYPGVFVDGVDFGGKNENEIREFFAQKNQQIGNTTFTFKDDTHIATISAKEIHLGFDEILLAKQAYSVGRTGDILTRLGVISEAYFNTVRFSPFYHYDQEKLAKKLEPITNDISEQPVDALFSFENGRVVTFRPSSNGKQLDMQQVNNLILQQLPLLITNGATQTFVFPIPIRIVKPAVSTDQANNLGIKELIGTGTSLFQHSIPGRVFNITLAASRINGVLVAPGETFSFDKALGDVSAFTGYKQAYVIENGKTVLGDGGGVCQVSTTFFRALLNAGLPIVERNAHAYRVQYYEEDSPPGIDATIYVPSVDLRFKNDTAHYILIQNSVDQDQLRITFYLYGTSDGRKVTMTKPIITSQSAPPPPRYQDDPTLSKGSVKQVDFQAWGAKVTFSRTVVKNGKVILADKFDSNYQPWQAVYLRGTKE